MNSKSFRHIHAKKQAIGVPQLLLWGFEETYRFVNCEHIPFSDDPEYPERIKQVQKTGRLLYETASLEESIQPKSTGNA